jgi:succinoglycan biosynthesis protein ExoA
VSRLTTGDKCAEASTTAKRSPSVSIIVPCRNEVKSITPFIDCILKQDLSGIDWEVVIADGMSNDGSREKLSAIARTWPRIRVIDNPGRIVPTGLNAAIRAARGDIIVRMDVHTEYCSTYVRKSVELSARTGAASVGGACIARGTGYLGRAIAAAFQSGFAVGGARWHRPAHEGPVDTVHLGCWRREVLREIGLFDEDLVRNQDDELNFRLRLAGGTIWQSPEIVSWYHPRSSLSHLFWQYFQFGFWRIPILRKHGSLGAWRQVVPAVFILANLALLATVLALLATGRRPISLFTTLGIAGDAIYLLANLLAAFIVAQRNDWTLLPILPLVFLTYHVSYGIGFLTGIVYFLTRSQPRPQREQFFDQLSR